MNFLISEARADAPAAAAQPQGNVYAQFLPLVALGAIFYFMLIRPQQKRAKEHRALLSALQKGDEIVVSGGTLGRVTDLSDNYVTVEIADGVNVKVQRQSVQSVLPKGTIKAA